MERLPNSLSFRKVTTLDLTDERAVPPGFTGRVRLGVAGVLRSVQWYERGELHDPAHDVPAVTTLRPSGDVKQVRHYHRGRLHDPEPDVPAVRGFFADGTLKYAEHFRFGWRSDAGDTPAIRKWRSDGTLRTFRRYRNNVRIDRPDTESSAHRPD